MRPHRYTPPRPEGLFCYLVGWDEHLIIKAGVTMYRSRWRAFENRGARLYQLHRSDRSSRTLGWIWLEGEIEGYLAPLTSYAFEAKQEARTFLGGGGSGYLECRRAPNVDAYRDALAACSRIMLAHGGGQCSEPMPAQMHGRTDARTYEDPHSPTRPPLVSDAHAHIREMAVDKSGGKA